MFVRVDISIEKPGASTGEYLVYLVRTVLNISTGNIKQLMIELDVLFQLVILFSKMNSLM